MAADQRGDILVEPRGESKPRPLPRIRRSCVIVAAALLMLVIVREITGSNELTSSFTFAAADVSIELYGTKGTVLVAGVDLASRDITPSAFVRRYRVDQPERRWEIVPLTPRFKIGEFHHQNAIAFVDCLDRGTAAPITVEDGLRAVQMIMAAYRAASTGQREIV
jgi:predicted dehydrogenase